MVSCWDFSDTARKAGGEMLVLERFGRCKKTGPKCGRAKAPSPTNTNADLRYRYFGAFGFDFAEDGAQRCG